MDDHLAECECCRRAVAAAQALLAVIVADGAELLAKEALGE